VASHGREGVSGGDDAPVTQSMDTSPEIEAMLVQGSRALSPAAKWRQVCEQIAADDAHALAGIRLRHPGAPAHEQRLRLAALKYDRELMRDAFGWDPAREGW
jgi:hypothetical protein